MISAPTASNETRAVGRWLAAAAKYISFKRTVEDARPYALNCNSCLALLA